MLHTGDVLVDQLLIPFVLWIFIVAVDLDQQLGKGVDTMHLTLDRWVGTFPGPQAGRSRWAPRSS